MILTILPPFRQIIAPFSSKNLEKILLASFCPMLSHFSHSFEKLAYFAISLQGYIDLLISDVLISTSLRISLLHFI